MKRREIWIPFNIAMFQKRLDIQKQVRYMEMYEICLKNMLKTTGRNIPGLGLGLNKFTFCHSLGWTSIYSTFRTPGVHYQCSIWTRTWICRFGRADFIILKFKEQYELCVYFKNVCFKLIPYYSVVPYNLRMNDYWLNQIVQYQHFTLKFYVSL